MSRPDPTVVADFTIVRGAYITVRASEENIAVFMEWRIAAHVFPVARSQGCATDSDPLAWCAGFYRESDVAKVEFWIAANLGGPS